MNFKEWSDKYYPNETEETLHKMSHAWASGHANMAASSVGEQRISNAWLIENGEAGDNLRYRSFKDCQWIWVSSPYEAIWFARSRDAERLSVDDEDAWFVREHIFD